MTRTIARQVNHHRWNLKSTRQTTQFLNIAARTTLFKQIPSLIFSSDL